MPSILWTYVALAACILLALGIWLAAHLLRARRRDAAARSAAQAARAARESEAELLDSSHVGFAPLIDPVTLPPAVGAVHSANRK